MMQTGLDFDLAGEAVCQLVLLIKIRKKNLPSFDALRNHVPNLEDCSHAASTHRRNNLVVTDSFADLMIVSLLHHSSCRINSPPRADIATLMNWRVVSPPIAHKDQSRGRLQHPYSLDHVVTIVSPRAGSGCKALVELNGCKASLHLSHGRPHNQLEFVTVA